MIDFQRYRDLTAEVAARPHMQVGIICPNQQAATFIQHQIADALPPGVSGYPDRFVFANGSEISTLRDDPQTWRGIAWDRLVIYLPSMHTAISERDALRFTPDVQLWWD